MMKFVCVCVIREWCNQQYTETQDKLDYTEKQLDILTDETKNNITQMSDEVEKKASENWKPSFMKGFLMKWYLRE